MTLQEMFDYVLIESGQFFVPVENLEINRDRFLTLVKTTLGIFNGKHPHERKFNLDFQTRAKTFTLTTKDQLGALTGIPAGIADMVPVRIAGVSPFFLREHEAHNSNYMNDKTSLPWEYRAPILYVPIQGVYDVHAWYNHELTEIVPEGEGTEGETKSYEVKTIDYGDDVFFKLLKSKFIRGIAGSRRAFTMQDIPLTTDADTLMTEAKTMEEEALKDLDDKTKFWLGWG